MSDRQNNGRLPDWLGGGERPVIISGPCSAESEEQTLETARRISTTGKVSVFRAGVWKPRTRPGMFEGRGEKALQWLQKVKELTGLKVTVEVANPEHIELALKYGIDILWIGARTVVNPFSMQEVAHALRGVDIPVMVKNPVNPDLNLWLGALERLREAGITRMAAIHRGFWFFERSPYRNAPMWEIPIELKRQCPDLPMICDPSHICGTPSLLLPVAQKALDLEMDGLMIESHSNPKEALTDARQQITPEELNELINSLIIRDSMASKNFRNRLEKLRSEVDKIDGELLQILARRMELIDELGKYKRDHNITILQLKRWSNIVEERLKMGVASGLDRDFLLRILEIVHTESIRRQSEIYGKQEE
ncbi:MAG: bifunctional 3-deoxy-7-phosphoheptulonate synthase/chorismate mutase type II [Bacteroidales bacterium]